MTALPGRIHVGADGVPDRVDLLVVGLGITGAGVALDAVSRGLSVAAVDAFDLAWGTSRFSSKLVHGGLRYLAHGQLGVAHESAVERGILMRLTAPHLVHPLPMLTPLTPALSRSHALLTRGALAAGQLLGRSAHTGHDLLPRSRRISATEALALAPAIRRDGLRGALLGWDGQLEDDARLVVTVARTAAALGASIHTRTRVLCATDTSATLRDEHTGETRSIRARAVVNATGVWAAGLAPSIRLRPSRGTHLVIRARSLPQLRCALMAPVPGATGRFVFALPQPDGLFYVGLTDEETDEPVPDVAVAPDADVDFLLETIGSALERPLTRADVVGSYAGLRPLLDSAGATADLSRRHAVLDPDGGVVTIVGGKLTTYRRMAEDTVNHLVRTGRVHAGPCRTRCLPLLGAAPRDRLGEVPAPPRLVRRFGTEAPGVLEHARDLTGLADHELVGSAEEVSLAELVFAVTHEGAACVDDLLDRRTRVGLVPADRAAVVPLAERALRLGLDRSAAGAGHRAPR